MRNFIFAFLSVKMSIIHVTDSKTSKTLVDRTPFIGHKVPDSVKVMIKTLKKVDKTSFRKFLQGRY